MDASNQVNPELSQIQNRLLNLTNQIEHIHTNIDRLTVDMQNSGIQLDALTHNLTSPDGNQQVAGHFTEHWSQMFERLEEYHDKMDDLLGLTKQSAGSQQLNELAQALSQTNENVARNQEQLDELAKSLKKLTRTQFKANTLGENKDQHLNSAFNTLQDMAVRRETADEDQILQNRVQMDQARKEGRTELVAEMLPAMDSLERALESGASLSERQKQEVEKYLNSTSLEVPGYLPGHSLTPSPAPISTHKKSGWNRLVSALAGVETEPSYQQPSFSNAVSIVESEALATQAQNHAENLSQVTAGSEAWLDGLHLVRERFLSVLATENVEPIRAMGEQFDPRLHVAISTQEREDIPNNEIIGVTRAGYYQDGRVLRYAEVSVARSSVPAPVPEPVAVWPSDEESGEDDNDDESNIIAGAALGTAAAAVVGAELLDNEVEPEPELQIEPEPAVELELEESSEIEVNTEEIEIGEPLLELDPPAEVAADLPDVMVEAESVEPIEDEIVLSPSQMPDYMPATSETYVDEYADVRKAILGHMLGQPVEPEDSNDAIPVETEVASESVEIVSSESPEPRSQTESSTASAAPSMFFETDEQVSMNQDTDRETFMASEPPEQQDLSNIEQATSYPDKTNVQSEISWVQYESPKRGSWLSRLFGNS